MVLVDRGAPTHSNLKQAKPNHHSHLDVTDEWNQFQGFGYCGHLQRWHSCNILQRLCTHVQFGLWRGKCRICLVCLIPVWCHSRMNNILIHMTTDGSTTPRNALEHLMYLDDIIEDFRELYQNHGGGYVNHAFTFFVMGPVDHTKEEDLEPTGKVT